MPVQPPVHRHILSPSRLLALALMLLLALPGLAGAQEEAEQYGVLPFSLNGPAKYAHLSRGIQDMLSSRLAWKDKLSPTDTAVLRKQAEALDEIDEAAAKKLLEQNGLDYIVYGSVFVVDQEASLDAVALGKDGKRYTESAQTKLANLIPALDTLARSLGGSILGRPAAAAQTPSAEPGQPAEAVSKNSAFVYNETGAEARTPDGSDPLNPRFRYETGGVESGRLRSQALTFTANAMEVADIDSDGKNEIVFIEDYAVHIYGFKGDKLEELASYTHSQSLKNLNLSLADTNRDGVWEIIITAIREGGDNRPRSYMLNYVNREITVKDSFIPYFVNVVRTPPDYLPSLVGQDYRTMDLYMPGVYELIKMGNEWTKSKRLLLPEEATAFNFTFLPEAREGADGATALATNHKILMLDENQHIKVFTNSLDLLFTSDVIYSGSAVYIEHYEDIPGVHDTELPSEHFYIPLPLIAADLDKNGQYELLTCRPISTAAEFFARYRFYPQGEIHSLFWDGVGLNLSWKTRTIKGTVVDFCVADAMDDGVDDLIVCTTTHPGLTGFGERRTIVMYYPLGQ